MPDTPPPTLPDDAEEQFDYHVTKDNKVLIYWYGRLVTTLANKQAQKFLRSAEAKGADVQQLMARFTGNFKRGNERTGKSSRDQS